MSSAAQQALGRRPSDRDAIEEMLERVEEIFPSQPDVRTRIIYDFAKRLESGDLISFAVRTTMQHWKLT